MTGRPIAIDDIFRLTLVGDARIAPDARRIAYVVKTLDQDENDYVSNIYLWEGGESRQFTSGGKDTCPRWSPDGKWLAFLSKRDEKAQIYLMSTEGGEAAPLTDRKEGVGTPVWSPDGQFIAFAGLVSTQDEEAEEKGPKTRVIERAIYKADGTGFVDDRRRHIFTVDVRTRETRQITDGDANDNSPTWAPDGEYLAFAANRKPDWDLVPTSDIWVVPRQGGNPRRITDGHGSWSEPVFSPDGGDIAMVGFSRPVDQEPSYLPQLWTISRGGGEPRNLLAGTDLAVGDSMTTDWSIAGEGSPQWAEDGIYFLVTEAGTCNINRWQEGVVPVTQGRRHVMDFSVAGGQVACTVANACHPAEIALVDAGEGPRILTSHNAEVLREAQPVQPEHIPFAGADGARIDGWLMKPAGYVEGRTYPLIVYIHGGPVAAYGESFFHEFQALAGQGFGVFYCNPHGSSSYGREFQVSIMGGWGTVDYADVMAGTDRAEEEPWIDRHRLGVAGGSYGGYLTNWVISHTDRFAAACTQRSICNMVSQGGASDWASFRGERMRATPEGNPDKLWDMSPLKYASNVKTPTLILHSERDDRCPIEEGEQWFAALRRQRVPVRFVRFPEESHGLSRGGKPSRRIERMRHISDWFKTYL